ncbi:MAG: NapC/NirT family cytochrome c [Verrucomicrobiota bacterium]|nr:NapC/NirT family cytochrome c [Verrucomicrobiota bacterium]
MSQSNQPRHSPGLSRNWLTLAGTILAAGGLLAFLLLFAIDMTAHGGNPYIGLLAYVVAPGFMLLGFLLAVLGIWIHRRHRQKAGTEAPSAIMIDLRRPRDRRILAGAAFGTAIFAMMTAVGSYETYRYTESNQFCGKACHTPMKPEYTAYQNSPHARVDCVECHVGHGASAYVKAKLNGVHQLVGVLTGDYNRPIKTPVPNMRPAQETCEQCHWPERNSGQLDRTYYHFLADETNTAFAVRLSLNVGGGNEHVGGIHWHMNLANKVEYLATDDQRQTIPWVRVTDSKGQQREYRLPGFVDAPEKHKVRTMDCMDCHNRPAHQFSTPNDAVDEAIMAGKIDRTIPWVKSNVVAVLTAQYSTEEEAVARISAHLKTLYPAEPRMESAIAAAQSIFKQNFFPEMKADWRAYPDNIGHKEWLGCFRCHDGQHKSTDGRMIAASSCNSCHTILAQGSAETDLQKLEAKGHAFFHIDAVNEDFSCNNCHTGGFPRE